MMEILADWLKFSSCENGLNKNAEMDADVQNNYGLKEITTHGLRHTHCSLLFEAGAMIKEVQDSLGHDDVQTTMIYAHVTKKVKAETIQNFVDYLN